MAKLKRFVRIDSRKAIKEREQALECLIESLLIELFEEESVEKCLGLEYLIGFY